jgi:cation:H+ antiporter
MLLHAALIVAALVVLVVGAELLVRGATAIASRSRMSPFFVGLTIVGFGTSTPELATSALAAARGLDGIAVGNVVGSNLFNLTVILGVTAMIRSVAVATRAIRVETWGVILVAPVPLLSLLHDGKVGRAAGALMLALLGAYVWASYRAGAAHAPGPPDGAGVARSATSGVARIGVGLACLVGGSYLLVESASRFALGVGMSELAVGLTVVAAGTSAPELVTSLVAAARGQTDLAVGNVFGSNVFNMLGILGFTCLLQPQTVPTQVVVLDTTLLVVVSVAMLPILASQGRVSRIEGAALCSVYLLYLGVLFLWAPGWFARP